MSTQELEDRIKRLEENARVMSDDVDSLKTIETKLDQLNSIAAEIKVNSTNVHNAMKRQETFLEEIKIGADFRKRESETSVRELKTQMSSMELNSESTSKDVIQKILDAIKDSELKQKDHIEKINNEFNRKLSSFEDKLKFNSTISFTALAVALTALIFILFV